VPHHGAFRASDGTFCETAWPLVERPLPMEQARGEVFGTMALTLPG
jgi:hypothetical protein